MEFFKIYSLENPSQIHVVVVIELMKQRVSINSKILRVKIVLLLKKVLCKKVLINRRHEKTLFTTYRKLIKM